MHIAAIVAVPMITIVVLLGYYMGQAVKYKDVAEILVVWCLKYHGEPTVDELIECQRIRNRK